MTNDDTFRTILSFLSDIYQKGNDILVYNGAYQVNVNQFFIAISIFFIVISALLNFVKAGANTGMVSTSVRNMRTISKRRKYDRLANKYYNELVDNNGVDPW